MAGTKKASLNERNRRICLYRRNGFTYSEIADLEGVSRARVAQIVAETNAELGEDDGRAEIATLLEFAERKCIELINDPGGVPGPNGRLVVDEDGVPVPNRGITVDALKTLMVVEDRKAKLFGWEKQPKKQATPEDIAMTQMHASIAEFAARKLEDDARREARIRELEERERQFGAVIPGEVIPALPPPDQPAA